ncbi:MAG TPA: hypothetical protein VIT92_06095 [Burkholderiaceae bacterium]
MTAAPAALATPADVTAAADSLTAAADVLRKRLQKELARGLLTHEEAQRWNEQEALLRQNANALYLDAAGLVLADVPLAQERLLSVIDYGTQRIARLEKFTVILAIATDLALIAGAIALRKVTPLLASVKKLKADSAAFAAR